jgi:hypothetical protein
MPPEALPSPIDSNPEDIIGPDYRTLWATVYLYISITPLLLSLPGVMSRDVKGIALTWGLDTATIRSEGG